MQVRDILARKQKPAYFVLPTDTITTLSTYLRDRRIGAVVVSTDGRTIEGVISERDVAHKLCQHAANFGAVTVGELMTRVVITCRLNDPVAQIATTMSAHNIRHVPVVDDEGLHVGMVSIRDVLNLRVDELQREAALLRTMSAQPGPPVEDRE